MFSLVLYLMTFMPLKTIQLWCVAGFLCFCSSWLPGPVWQMGFTAMMDWPCQVRRPETPRSATTEGQQTQKIDLNQKTVWPPGQKRVSVCGFAASVRAVKCLFSNTLAVKLLLSISGGCSPQVSGSKRQSVEYWLKYEIHNSITASVNQVPLHY